MNLNDATRGGRAWAGVRAAWFGLVLSGCPVESDDLGSRTCDDLLSVELPSCDVATACHGDDTGNLPDCRQPLSESLGCDPDWQELFGGTTQEGLLYAGGGGPSEGPSSLATSFTFTDASSFDAWRFSDRWGDAAADWPAVDFERQIVVVVQHEQSCGLSLVRHGVWWGQYPDLPAEVYVEFEDDYGSCEQVCDLNLLYMVVYAVDRSRGWPAVCSSIINRCG